MCRQLRCGGSTSCVERIKVRIITSALNHKRFAEGQVQAILYISTALLL